MSTVEDLRESYKEDPDDIVSRLLDGAEDADCAPSQLLIEAAKTIDNLRNGYGG